MIKSIQLKIILIFIIVGIVIITSLGCMYLYELKQIMNNIDTYDFEQSELLLMDISTKIKTIQIAILSAILLFSVISVILGIFAVKAIISPISTLIESAEKIAAGEVVDIKYLSNSDAKTEVGDLVKAFSLMTTELQTNLNEVSRQKRQIETILLHMTDGIIAFDLERRNFAYEHLCY